MNAIFAQVNGALSGVIAGVLRAVVQVRDDDRGSAGAGTIWQSDGLIITNAHVVRAGRANLSVALHDGRVLNARVVARDEAHDLAALAIDAHDLPTITVGSLRDLQVGQWVMALGHPWGVLNATTGGVLIGVGQGLPEVRVTPQDYVVADLHLRPGNSGGPLIDTNGRMIGVNTLMTSPGVGVAVGVDAVKAFLKRELERSTPQAAADVVAAPQYV